MGLLFSSSAHTLQEEQTSSIDSLTDEEVYALIQKRSSENRVGLPIAWNPLIVDTVWRIAPDAVVKRTFSPTEAFMMNYVSSQTSIPIPKVRRVLPENAPNTYWPTWWIVMDYIEGDVLHGVWGALSWWRRLRIIWHLYRSLTQLRKVPVPNPDVPGPFDASGKPYRCDGHYFTENGAGPFHSYSEMATWFDRRRFDTIVGRGLPRNWSCPTFDASHPLVLCHMDLHMRNIVVDKNGVPYIVDWANAGAFPAWLEYAHLVIWRGAMRDETHAPKSWTFFARFIVGNYERYVSGYLDLLWWAWDRPVVNFPLDYFEKLDSQID